jgi:hypothetical protein
LIIAIDASTQHRVFANASSTNPRKTTEVARHPSGHVRVVTLPVCRIAGVRGALVLIIAIGASTQHRVFANASSTNPRKTTEVAGHPSGHVRIVTLAIRRVAGVGGALVLIIAVDVRAQHAATGSTTACGTTGTGYPTGATRAAGA